MHFKAIYSSDIMSNLIKQLEVKALIGIRKISMFCQKSASEMPFQTLHHIYMYIRNAKSVQNSYCNDKNKWPLYNKGQRSGKPYHVQQEVDLDIKPRSLFLSQSVDPVFGQVRESKLTPQYCPRHATVTIGVASGHDQLHHTILETFSWLQTYEGSSQWLHAIRGLPILWYI